MQNFPEESMTFLDVMVYNLIDGYQHLERTGCHHFLNEAIKLHDITSQMTATLILAAVIISNPICDS
jgi:hypothetical protein